MEMQDVISSGITVKAVGPSGQEMSMNIPLRITYTRPTLGEIKRVDVGTAPELGRPTLGVKK